MTEGDKVGFEFFLIDRYGDESYTFDLAKLKHAFREYQKYKKEKEEKEIQQNNTIVEDEDDECIDERE